MKVNSILNFILSVAGRLHWYEPPMAWYKAVSTIGTVARGNGNNVHADVILRLRHLSRHDGRRLVPSSRGTEAGSKTPGLGQLDGTLASDDGRPRPGDYRVMSVIVFVTFIALYLFLVMFPPPSSVGILPANRSVGILPANRSVGILPANRSVGGTTSVRLQNCVGGVEFQHGVNF